MGENDTSEWTVGPWVQDTEAQAKGASQKLGAMQEAGFGGGGGGGVAEVDLTEVNERLDKVEGQIKEMSRNVAKKLALMIDLMMSLSDQISNAQAVPGTHAAHSMGGGAIVPGAM